MTTRGLKRIGLIAVGAGIAAVTCGLAIAAEYRFHSRAMETRSAAATRRAAR